VRRDTLTNVETQLSSAAMATVTLHDDPTVLTMTRYVTGLVGPALGRHLAPGQRVALFLPGFTPRRTGWHPAVLALIGERLVLVWATGRGVLRRHSQVMRVGDARAIGWHRRSARELTWGPVCIEITGPRRAMVLGLVPHPTEEQLADQAVRLVTQTWAGAR
jgi:hypothetical protein